MPRLPHISRRLRSAAVVGAAVVLFIAVDGLVLAELHARGYGQAVLAYFDGLASLLQSPGVLVVDRGGQLGTHHFTPLDWAVVILVDLVVYASMAWIWYRLRPRRRPQAMTEQPQPPEPAPALPSRRQFLSTGAKLAGLGVAATGAYALVVEPREYEVARRQIRIQDLPTSLDGITVAQLTDIHLGPWLSLAYVRDVVAATNRLGADLIALTGDYIHKSWRYIDPVMDSLSQLRANIGIVATLGNHDHYEGAGKVAAGLARIGVPLIDNARLILTPDRKLVADADQGLCIAGVADLWTDVPKYEPALGGLPPRMPRLLLSHNPDVAEEGEFLAARLRVDLMLSGHTHGGQVYIPGLGTPVLPSHYGQKYASGLVQGPACPVYVSRGIGVSSLPIRIGVRPEIALLQLRRG